MNVKVTECLKDSNIRKAFKGRKKQMTLNVKAFNVKA